MERLGTFLERMTMTYYTYTCDYCHEVIVCNECELNTACKCPNCGHIQNLTTNNFNKIDKTWN